MPESPPQTHQASLEADHIFLEANSSQTAPALTNPGRHTADPGSTSACGNNLNAESCAEFVFLSHTMEIGGIETLLVRMATQISKAGFRVTVFAPYGPMSQTLHPNVRLIESVDFDSATLLRLIQPHHETKRLYVWASLPRLLFPIFLFQHELWKSKEIISYSVSGIFHPEQWKRKGTKVIQQLFSIFMQAATPAGSIYFMNESCRDSHIKRWGRNVSRWPVHKLAIDSPTETWNNHKGNVLKIVSVGRLTPFKAYNFGAIAVGELLDRKGISFIWHIWGDGEDEHKLREAINAKGLDDKIILMGSLPYARFINTIKNYDLFVGMGTAAIEAAQISMPTIVSIVSMPLGTYGFLFEAPSDSIGEKTDGAPVQSLTENILAYSESSPLKRKEIGALCSETVRTRAGGEAAPFLGMFHAGIRVPDRSTRNLGFGLMSLMFNVKKKFRG